MLRISLFAALLLPTPPCRALQSDSKDSQRYSRFLTGYPEKPAPNPLFIFNHLDMTGIGWQPQDDAALDRDDPNSDKARAGDKTVTLISPRHFIGAKHWKLEKQVSFMNAQGRIITYEIDGYESIGENTDIVVGRLKAPVLPQDDISYYPVLDLGNFDNYRGQTAVYFGKASQAGKSKINKVDEKGASGPRFILGDYKREDPDRVWPTGGDSGSPSFIEVNGRLTLIGHHHTSGRDPVLVHYKNEIDSVLSKDGYSLKVVDENYGTSKRPDCGAGWMSVPIGGSYNCEKRRSAEVKTVATKSTALLSGNDQDFLVTACPSGTRRIKNECKKSYYSGPGLYRMPSGPGKGYLPVKACLQGEVSQVTDKPLPGDLNCVTFAPAPRRPGGPVRRR